MRNKIVLTGAAGFVGSNLCNRLRTNPNYDILGIDDFRFGSLSNLDLRSSDNWEFANMDFNDFSIEGVNCYDTLIHCATSNIIYSQEKPIETFINNALNTILLFEKFKGKIIYLSTSSVYGNPVTIPTTEHERTKPYNAYDTSKLVAELYLKQRGNYTTLRLNNTYGVNQRPDSPYSGVLGKFINCALYDKPMTIYRDGTDTRSYTHVGDVVDAIIKSVELPAQNTEINIGSPEEISSMDLCKLVWKTVDKPVQYTIVKPRSIDSIKRRALDCTKAKELLGWEAKVELEEGVNKTLEWQKSL